MNIKFSSVFEDRLEKLARRDKKILNKLRKQINFIKTNINHPSLRLHKLDSIVDDLWSISIDRKLRVIFVWDVDGDEVCFVDIGNHDQVYR